MRAVTRPVSSPIGCLWDECRPRVVEMAWLSCSIMTLARWHQLEGRDHSWSPRLPHKLHEPSLKDRLDSVYFEANRQNTNYQSLLKWLEFIDHSRLSSYHAWIKIKSPLLWKFIILEVWRQRGEKSSDANNSKAFNLEKDNWCSTKES